MNQSEILTAIYNDKELLQQFNQSVNEHILSLRSLEQLQRDLKDTKSFIKEKYGLLPKVFEQICKTRMSDAAGIDELINQLEMIKDIAIAADGE